MNTRPIRSWEAWLYRQRLNSRMLVIAPGLSMLEDWIMDKESIKRHDGKFFSVIGVHVQDGEKWWDQPMIEEGSEGVAVLLTDGSNFLLQAAAEPGNVHAAGSETLLRPTLQSSRSHWKLEEPQRAELARTQDVGMSVLAQQDGSRFFGKQVSLEIQVVDNLEAWVAEHGGLQPNERIFSGRELSEAILEGECNQFLRELAGLFWAIGFGQTR